MHFKLLSAFCCVVGVSRSEEKLDLVSPDAA